MTQDDALDLFRYDYVSGKLYWKHNMGSNKVKDTEAGNIDDKGYVRLQYKRKKYRAHRIIWLIVYGYMPKNIDHINHDRVDNRLINLRDVTHIENGRNRLIVSNNTSGVMGVCWSKNSNKWRAYIKFDGVQVSLGYHIRYSDAVDARKNAEILYGYHENHGAEKTMKIYKGE